jgi:hypothetical protein
LLPISSRPAVIALLALGALQILRTGGKKDVVHEQETEIGPEGSIKITATDTVHYYAVGESLVETSTSSGKLRPDPGSLLRTVEREPVCVYEAVALPIHIFDGVWCCERFSHLLPQYAQALCQLVWLGVRTQRRS